MNKDAKERIVRNFMLNNSSDDSISDFLNCTGTKQILKNLVAIVNQDKKDKGNGGHFLTTSSTIVVGKSSDSNFTKYRKQTMALLTSSKKITAEEKNKTLDASQTYLEEKCKTFKNKIVPLSEAIKIFFVSIIVAFLQ